MGISAHSHSCPETQAVDMSGLKLSLLSDGIKGTQHNTFLILKDVLGKFVVSGYVWKFPGIPLAICQLVYVSYKVLELKHNQR